MAPLPKLDDEPPDDDASGEQFDQAVEADAVSVTLPAAIPALTATVASIDIQPTLSHASQNARLMAAARSAAAIVVVDATAPVS